MMKVPALDLELPCSPDEVDVQIDLPDNLSAVYDKYGQEINPDTSQITVNSPVFFELNP